MRGKYSHRQEIKHNAQLLSVGRIHNSNVFKTTIQIDFIHSVPFARDIDSVLAYCLCQT